MTKANETKSLPRRPQDYMVVVRALAADEGGGFLAEIPDLPGCTGDGETEQAAIDDAHDAAREWMEETRRLGRSIPRPGSADAYSGKWVQRVPKSLHRRLASQAKREGVSLNTLAATLLAEGLSHRRD
jgi:antitoxin HicB